MEVGRVAFLLFQAEVTQERTEFGNLYDWQESLYQCYLIKQISFHPRPSVRTDAEKRDGNDSDNGNSEMKSRENSFLSTEVRLLTVPHLTI